MKSATGGIPAWIHDDITWCLEENCPVVDCMRNRVNIINRSGLHSFAMFRGTEVCPVSRGLDRCMDGCKWAKEAFAEHHDPHDAVRALADRYCENCIFAESAED